MAQILQVLAIATVTFGTGAATMGVMNEDIPDLQVPEGNWSAEGLLDGRTLVIEGRDVDSGTITEDELVFRNGTMMSTNCQEYCDFGWSEYQTQTIDGVIHFTATAACPDAPHTIVFYGQIEGDTVTADASWTTRRWYWTHQIVMDATGTVMPTPDMSTSG